MAGRIQDPAKIVQLTKVLDALSLKSISTVPVISIKQSSWITGLFDADGSANCNQTTLNLV